MIKAMRRKLTSWADIWVWRILSLFFGLVIVAGITERWDYIGVAAVYLLGASAALVVLLIIASLVSLIVAKS